MWHPMFIYVTPNVYLFDIQYVSTWHPMFIYVTYNVHLCDIQYKSIWHPIFIYIWHTMFIYVTHYVHLCDTECWSMWHWMLIYMCHTQRKTNSIKSPSCSTWVMRTLESNDKMFCLIVCKIQSVKVSNNIGLTTWVHTQRATCKIKQ